MTEDTSEKGLQPMALAEKVYGSKSQVDKVMGRWLRDAGQE